MVTRAWLEAHREKVSRDNHYKNKKKIAEESEIVYKTDLSRLALIYPRLRMPFIEWIKETYTKKNYLKEWNK